jgi:hypothetical protein
VSYKTKPPSDRLSGGGLKFELSWNAPYLIWPVAPEDTPSPQQQQAQVLGDKNIAELG